MAVDGSSLPSRSTHQHSPVELWHWTSSKPPSNLHRGTNLSGSGGRFIASCNCFWQWVSETSEKKDHHIYKSPPRDLQSIQPLPIMCTTKVKSILWEIFYAYAVEYTSMKGQPYQLPTEVYISETNDYLALSRPDYPSPDFVLCPVTLRLHGWHKSKRIHDTESLGRLQSYCSELQNDPA